MIATLIGAVALTFSYEINEPVDSCSIYQKTEAGYIEIHRTAPGTDTFVLENGNPEDGSTLIFAANCRNAAGEGAYSKDVYFTSIKATTGGVVPSNISISISIQ